MKKISFNLLLLAAFTLLFYSCSKEEESSTLGNEKATLSFGTVLNELIDQKSGDKQMEFPECSDDAPAFVDIVLSGTTAVGTTGDPLRVSLNPNPADYDGDGIEEYFTDEHADLELEPGPYSLDWFVVRNADLEIIWVAPLSSGNLASLVPNPLPFEFNLGAGVKKYVDVGVVCYDDRVVNEYGYLFFDIEASPAFDYCFFANYCDENGRHYPAALSVDIWIGTDSSGELLYSEELNEVGINSDGDAFANPVCLVLPNLSSFGDNEDYLYYEVSLLDWEEVYGEAPSVSYSGTLSRADIEANFDGGDNVFYQHIRFGCGDESGEPPMDNDGDGVNDDRDDCPNTPPGTSVDENGCEITGDCDPEDPNHDCDNDGVLNGVDNCPDTDPGVAVGQDGCESITVPGRDIVVLNDVNVFDNVAMEDPNNVRFVQNLINFSTTGSRNSGDVIMWNFQNGLGASSVLSLWAEMKNVISAEGYNTSITYTQNDLLDIPSDVKVVMLVMPLVQYSVEAINSLKSFAAEGGRIIFMGEHDEIYGAGIPIENDFLISMGAVLRNTGGYVDCLERQGQPHIEISSNSLREHPIMEGINSLSIACASIIEPGPDDFPLFYDTTNSHVLGGVAKIDVTPITKSPASSATKSYRAEKSTIKISDFSVIK